MNEHDLALIGAATVVRDRIEASREGLSLETKEDKLIFRCGGVDALALLDENDHLTQLLDYELTFLGDEQRVRLRDRVTEAVRTKRNSPFRLMQNGTVQNYITASEAALLSDLVKRVAANPDRWTRMEYSIDDGERGELEMMDVPIPPKRHTITISWDEIPSEE